METSTGTLPNVQNIPISPVEVTKKSEERSLLRRYESFGETLELTTNYYEENSGLTSGETRSANDLISTDVFQDASRNLNPQIKTIVEQSIRQIEETDKVVKSWASEQQNDETLIKRKLAAEVFPQANLTDQELAAVKLVPVVGGFALQTSAELCAKLVFSNGGSVVKNGETQDSQLEVTEAIQRNSTFGFLVSEKQLEDKKLPAGIAVAVVLDNEQSQHAIRHEMVSERIGHLVNNGVAQIQNGPMEDKILRRAVNITAPKREIFDSYIHGAGAIEEGQGVVNLADFNIDKEYADKNPDQVKILRNCFGIANKLVEIGIIESRERGVDNNGESTRTYVANLIRAGVTNPRQLLVILTKLAKRGDEDFSSEMISEANDESVIFKPGVEGNFIRNEGSFRVGSVVEISGQKYQVISKLGQGFSAVAYKAEILDASGVSKEVVIKETLTPVQIEFEQSPDRINEFIDSEYRKLANRNEGQRDLALNLYRKVLGHGLYQAGEMADAQADLIKVFDQILDQKQREYFASKNGNGAFNYKGDDVVILSGQRIQIPAVTPQNTIEGNRDAVQVLKDTFREFINSPLYQQRREAFFDRFKYISESQKLLNGHHGVPEIFSYSIVDKPRGGRTCCQVVEIIPGGNLGDFYNLEQISSPVKKAPYARVIRNMDFVLDALQEMHDKGFTYNDLKPANIVFDEKSKRYVLIDLGSISQLGERIPETSFSYAAPEVTANNMRGVASPQTDVYMVGMSLYQLLTGVKSGEMPNSDTLKDFQAKLNEAENSHKIVLTQLKELSEKNPPEIPPELVRIITKCIEPKPEDRYKSIAQIRLEINQIELNQILFSYLTFDTAQNTNDVRVREYYSENVSRIITIYDTFKKHGRAEFFKQHYLPVIEKIAENPNFVSGLQRNKSLRGTLMGLGRALSDDPSNPITLGIIRQEREAAEKQAAEIERRRLEAEETRKRDDERFRKLSEEAAEAQRKRDEAAAAEKLRLQQQRAASEAEALKRRQEAAAMIRNQRAQQQAPTQPIPSQNPAQNLQQAPSLQVAPPVNVVETPGTILAAIDAIQFNNKDINPDDSVEAILDRINQLKASGGMTETQYNSLVAKLSTDYANYLQTELVTRTETTNEAINAITLIDYRFANGYIGLQEKERLTRLLKDVISSDLSRRFVRPGTPILPRESKVAINIIQNVYSYVQTIGQTRINNLINQVKVRVMEGLQNDQRYQKIMSGNFETNDVRNLVSTAIELNNQHLLRPLDYDRLLRNIWNSNEARLLVKIDAINHTNLSKGAAKLYKSIKDLNSQIDSLTLNGAQGIIVRDAIADKYTLVLQGDINITTPTAILPETAQKALARIDKDLKDGILDARQAEGVRKKLTSGMVGGINVAMRDPRTNIIDLAKYLQNIKSKNLIDENTYYDLYSEIEVEKANRGIR